MDFITRIKIIFHEFAWTEKNLDKYTQDFLIWDKNKGQSNSYLEKKLGLSKGFNVFSKRIKESI